MKLCYSIKRYQVAQKRSNGNNEFNLKKNYSIYSIMEKQLKDIYFSSFDKSL